jgi:hypothetical protein
MHEYALNKFLIYVKGALIVFFIVLVSSCASVDTKFPWHPTQTGCYNHSISDTLLWWKEAPLSTASFRLAIDPDSGNGPTIITIIDSGKLINLGNPDNPPKFIGAVGDYDKTCVVRIPISECQSASLVYDKLRSQSIPLGFGMDDPREIMIFHAPNYYLEFSDGQGNHNQWQFYGSGHPLQKVVEESISKLKSCWLKAWDSYNENL